MGQNTALQEPLGNGDELEIARAVQLVATANGGNYLGDGPYSDRVVQALRTLAYACGVIDPMSATQADLASLYKVARKSIPATAQVASRINGKAKPFDPFSDIGKPAPKPEQVIPVGDFASKSDVFALRESVATVLDTLTRLSREVESAAPAYEVTALAGEVRELAAKITGLNGTIAEQVSAALKSLTPTQLEIVRPDAPPLPLGLVHSKTATILRRLVAGVNVYLHGPAGSGKTTAATKCAEALGVPFYFTAKVESEYLLLGFKDARGETVRTQFREAYEHGGVFLFDEADASSAGAFVALNAALANGVCPFPDGTVKRHPQFYCIAAGNTKLTGANRQYAGRTQMDAASVDRFTFLEFGYDEALEMELASNKGWCLHVQAMRAAVAERGLLHLISPRATYDGCKLLAAGDDWAEVEEACIFKGLDTDTCDQLRAAVKAKTGI